MKLTLLFIVLDLLTVLAYPIVYVDGILRRFSKAKEKIKTANGLFTGSVRRAGDRLEIMSIRKKGIYAYSNN